MTTFEPVTTAQAIDFVSHLAREIWNEHFPQVISQAQINYMLDHFQSGPAITRQIQEGTLYFLIKPYQQSVGFLALKPEQDASRLFLSKLYLRAEARGQGLARQALEFTVSLGRKMGLKTIYLTCNKRNTAPLDIYEHLGFHQVAAVVKDIGGGFVMDDYILEKDISA